MFLFFIIFCQYQGQGFLTKSLGKAFLGGNKRSLVMAMFRQMSIAVIFLHSFYVVSYLEGTLCHGSVLCRPLVEIRDRFKEKILFQEIYDFGTKKSTKPGQIKVLCFWDEKLTKLE